jgi:hypothetical protein
VRLPVKLGVFEPVDERDAVMVLVKVLDAEEPAVALREEVPVTVLVAVELRVGAGVREGVSVAESEAPGRERVAVPLAVPLAVALAVPLLVAPGRERVAVALAVPLLVAPGRERVAVAVAVPTAERLRTAEVEGVTGSGVPTPPPVPCVQPVDDRRAKNTTRNILSSYSYIT